jgi:nucleoside-diphosphate-sugar epimerase
MYALVTGAGGQLGRHLTAALARDGHRVRALDAASIPDAPELVDTIKGDVRNADIAQFACEGVDVVFHLASLSPQSEAKQESSYSINVKGTKNMLSAAVSESVGRFILSSSVEIYGIPDRVPCTEDAPKKLLGPFSRSMLECEELCAGHAADFGVEVAVLRTPTVFGPGHGHGSYYLKMFDALARGKPIRLMGGGGNMHQVVAASDAADAFILAAEAQAAPGETFNIASDPAGVLSMSRTAERVIERLGSQSKVKSIGKTPARILMMIASLVGRPILPDEHRSLPFADCVFDIEKAKQILGYKPRKDDVDAITETAQWYIENREAGDSGGE